MRQSFGLSAVKRKLIIVAISAMIIMPATAASFSETKRLAERGDAEAQSSIGFMYDVGKNVDRDYTKAMEWYLKAAAQNHADAQYNIGALYANGLGVKQDLKTAKEWAGKACDNGSQEGCDKNH